jgi:5'-methylthioadenosine phosphorylase
MSTRLAVIGGSGLYQLKTAEKIETVEVPTPFGLPSDLISIVKVKGHEVAFVPRHGKGHRLLPTEVPSKANIWALKSLGVEQILSISAVGSLREEIRPGDFVLCDQLIDRTRSRDLSFFGDGVVGHVPFAEPFCGGMRSSIAGILKKGDHPLHERGTLVTMEGPLFSTRAESHLYRGWGADLIGMTAIPEAKLAREAEICLAIVAMVTDYDCWREATESVTVEMILKVMRENTGSIQKVLPEMMASLAARKDCDCRRAAAQVMVTDPALIPYHTKRRLWALYGKYWKTLQP